MVPDADPYAIMSPAAEAVNTPNATAVADDPADANVTALAL
jgi:hypothetical protein